MSGTLSIRIAVDDDVSVAMELVRACIVDMRRAGIDQWDDLYPDETTLRADVRDRTMYVTSDDTGVFGIFVLNEYQDPEYADVFWTITDVPVAVVHRLMVHPRRQHQGMARRCFARQKTCHGVE
jgi:GNAT superfamily N-acetyltransferase